LDDCGKGEGASGEREVSRGGSTEFFVLESQGEEQKPGNPKVGDRGFPKKTGEARGETRGRVQMENGFKWLLEFPRERSRRVSPSGVGSRFSETRRKKGVAGEERSA